MTINIYVINQELRLATPFRSLIDGTQEFIKFKFILDDAWLKITTFAQFVQDDIAYNVYLDENNCVYLPPEINAGTFTLMLYGTGNNTIGTSNYLTLKVSDNILIEDAQSTEVTQSLYSQLVNIVDGVNDNINTITTARTSDVGKYLKVKSVNNGKVSAWEFDEGGSSEGGGGSGQDGQDGYSPTITVTNITGGHRVSITDVNGTKTFNVMNGTNGTNGTDGSDGFSPTITVTNITNGHRVSITDATGTNTFDVMNGTGGDGGSSISIDNTLTVSGAAADAKTVGDRLSNKVDVVSGKSLSTNDYTNSDKQKLDSISVSSPTDGQVLAYNSTTQKWVNKTISDGSEDDSGQSGNVFIGNTPLTLTEDTDIELVSNEETTYSYSPSITADFSQREDVRLNNVTLTEVDGNYEIEATEDATAFSEAYARMYFSGFTVGTEYSITVYPVVNDGEQVSGGTYGVFDAEGNLIKYFQTTNTEQTEMFVATETTMRFRIYPAGSYAWDRGYRKARISDVIIQPNTEANIVTDFSDRTEVVLNNTTLVEENGYFELTANENAESYVDAYATMIFNGLTVGKDYTIYITPQGDSANLISGGYYIFTNFDGNNIGELILLTESDTIDFTATTTSVRLRFYIGTAYFWQNNYRKARLSKLTITQKTEGTFNGKVRLGILSAGIEIRSTPSCEVYEVKEEEKEEQQKTRHAGKICVCFGDSVTGFMTPPNDYPSIIAKETGMTVYNVGFAGCRMSDTHPYPAYRVFGMTHLADAITSGDWTDQDSYVDQVEDLTFPQEHLANLKAINWNNVDFITIFYGGNDAGNGVPFGDPTGENIGTFLGAFNYSIKKILTTYPLIKILVLTPIFRYWVDEEKDSDEYDIPEYGTENIRKYYEWGDALIERAKVYKLPAVDMYRTLGINSITRTSYLKNDGAHPREEGNKLIGGKIAAKLLSEY